jgi:hypothetical protein
VTEKEGAAPKTNDIENIDIEGITEEEFLNKVVEKIGTI